MLKTLRILLFWSGSFVVVFCSDAANYDNLPSSPDSWQYLNDNDCQDTSNEDSCGPNEKYVDCVNGGCDRRYCSELKRPALCINVAQGYCVEGCVCKDDYLRNNDGDCVPINCCPERNNTKCRHRNEYYENCEDAANSCQCTKGCKCVLGYKRNRKGVCVLKSDPNFTTPSPGTTTTSTTPLPPIDNNYAEKALDAIWQGNADFTGKFLNSKTNESPNESFVASPFSVLIPLGQLALYANGTSQQQLLKLLNLDTKTEVQQGFRKLLDNLKSPKNVTLLLGQKAYANKQFELNPKFEDDTKRYFDSEAQNLDFSRNKEAAEIINNWVKKQTNGLIPNLIDAGLLNAFTRLVLVNAIYFKGDWLRPFNPESTQKKDFKVTKNNTVKVNMMYQEGTFGYTENSNFKALQLFYKDRDFSLLTVLPTPTDDYSLKGLAKQFEDVNAIKKIIESLKYEKVRVYLPSIQTSTTTNLSPILQQAHVTDVFNPGKAELSGILKRPENIFISEAIQKAFIVINERGSEAAAANAIVVGTTSIDISEPKIFEANKPYFYFILYKKNVLFCGSYKGK